jgi:hypothetical protein
MALSAAYVGQEGEKSMVEAEWAVFHILRLPVSLRENTAPLNQCPQLMRSSG